MKTLNKESIEWACKKVIFNQIKSSPYIRENSSLYERTNFKEWINNLTYEQTIMLMFEGKYIRADEQHVYEPKIRDRHNALQKALMYGAAFIAGRAGRYIPGVNLIPFKGLLAMLILMRYRQIKDPCIRQHKYGHGQEGIIKCNIAAAESTINYAKSEIGKCGNSQDPEKCRKKLDKIIIKWTGIKNDQMTKLRDYKND
jgi:hypothetical protein